MADRKISDLTALTTPAAGDYLPIVDISESAAASKNKRITIEELLRGAPDGTAAAPSIAFESDPNTGIYSPGADQVAISTNGTGRLFVDASGNVGAGTGSPSYQLDVAGQARFGGTNGLVFGVGNAFVANQGELFSISTTPMGLGTSGSASLQLYTNSAERARIDSSGRLLVGTSTVTGIPATLNVIGGNNTVLHTQGANADSPFLFLSHARGTGAQSVNAQDGVGAVAFVGYDGTNALTAARIEAFVDGTPGTNDMPGRLVFSFTPSGSATPVERLRITSAGVLQVADAGNITVGTTTGTKIGTATTQKLGFYNATPVVQPAAVADATTAIDVITQLNDLLAKLRTLGIIAT